MLTSTEELALARENVIGRQSYHLAEMAEDITRETWDVLDEIRSAGLALQHGIREANRVIDASQRERAAGLTTIAA